MVVERCTDGMVLRLSRRAFSSLVLGSLMGCDEHARETPIATAVSAPPEPLPPVTPSAQIVLPDPAISLFRAYPSLEKRVPRLPLGRYPTPIERAENLGREIGVPNLWIKRDDLSGDLYGGGKTRKLEFYLAEAKLQNAKEIATFGAYGSNQAVATALWGKAHGFVIRVVLAPQMPSVYVQKNLFALARAGARIEISRDGVGAAEVRIRNEAQRNAQRATYLIPPGGSSPLGNLAFVNAAFELGEQIKAGQCPSPDCIYLAMGTMGCVVGLALGLEMQGLGTEVVAVRASSAETSSDGRLRTMAKETATFVHALDEAIPVMRVGRARVRIQAHQLGGGYGFATRSGEAAMRVFAQSQGYALEPTYTAKAFAAVVADAKRLAGKTVLFWNSHNTRPIAVDGVRPDDFPRELQEYLQRL